MGVLRETSLRSEIEEFLWIPDKSNVANPLTKEGASALYLLQVLSGRLWFNETTGEFV